MIGLVVGFVLTVSTLVPVAVSGVAIVLVAGLAVHEDPLRRAAARAVVAFAVYQLLLFSIPTLWQLAHGVGGAVAVLPGLITGRPLWVGNTFGGTDFLVLTGLLAWTWYRHCGFRWGLKLAVAILAVHSIYLAVLSFSADFYMAPLVGRVFGRLPVEVLPLLPGLQQTAISFLAGTAGWEQLAKLAPWNLPAVAAVFHVAFLAVLLRRYPGNVKAPLPAPAARADRRMAVATLVVAALLPAVVTLTIGTASLAGKKVVVFEQCFGNWQRPVHGQYGRLSIGMYGMMERFVQSLGGKFVLTEEDADLSDEHLQGADVLVMTFPYLEDLDKEQLPWKRSQLEKIWRWVREGGSLVLLGEHTSKGNQMALSRRSAPPTTAHDGDSYILTGPPTGAWSEFAQNDVVTYNSGWESQTPREGWLVRLTDEHTWAYFNGKTWRLAKDRDKPGAYPWTVRDMVEQPPASPTPGEAFILNGPPTGEWSKFKQNDVLEYQSSWVAKTLKEGSLYRIQDQNMKRVYFDGTGWKNIRGTTPKGIWEVGGSRFNDLLQPTSMRVRFDSGMMEVGGWLQSYDAIAHPVTVGVSDERNEFGVVTGASMDVRWPARPVIIGKWGYADPGDASGDAMMGNHRYDPGEKLGDIVVCAEQHLGKGTIITFGDTSTVTNGINIGSHDFNARLLGYLGNRPGSPQAWWRQILGYLLGGGLLFLLLARVDTQLLVSASLVGSLSLILCVHIGFNAATLYPNGPVIHPNGADQAGENLLAYVDCAHMGRFDNESWRNDGNMGIKMTFMRDGFTSLEMHEFSRERLMGAGLFLSVAPRINYTPEECKILREWVEKGGIFVLTTAYPDRAGSKELLDTFGFEIGKMDSKPGVEPQPMGHFKAAYLHTPPGDGNAEGYYHWVRFHEAWPVSCTAADAPPAMWESQTRFDERTVQRFTNWLLSYTLGPAFPSVKRTHPALPRAYGTDFYPSILTREVGEGVVLVVADTGFALNKNLEVRGGWAFEGLRENPHFWRWLLADLRQLQRWIPPKPVPEKDPSAPVAPPDKKDEKKTKDKSEEDKSKTDKSKKDKPKTDKSKTDAKAQKGEGK